MITAFFVNVFYHDYQYLYWQERWGEKNINDAIPVENICGGFCVKKRMRKEVFLHPCAFALSAIFTLRHMVHNLLHFYSTTP